MTDVFGTEIKVGDVLLWAPYEGSLVKVDVQSTKVYSRKSWDNKTVTTSTIRVVRPHPRRKDTKQRVTLRNPNRVVVLPIAPQ